MGCCALMLSSRTRLVALAGSAGAEHVMLSDVLSSPGFSVNVFTWHEHKEAPLKSPVWNRLGNWGLGNCFALTELNHCEECIKTLKTPGTLLFSHHQQIPRIPASPSNPHSPGLVPFRAGQ